MNIKILLTSSGGGLGPEFLRLSKKIKKFKVINYAVDSNNNAPSKYFSDYFYKVSKGRSKKFISEIKNITKKNNINIVLPGSDEDALNLSKNRKTIENAITKIACVDYEILKILSNKQKTYDFLKKNNFDIPEYYVANTKKQLIFYIKYLIKKNRSAVIKPSISRGGRNVFIIRKSLKKIVTRNNGREIEIGISKFLKNFKKFDITFYPIIVMERLQNPTLDFDMLCFKGNLISGVTRRRINPSVPNDGHIIYNDFRLQKLGKKIANLLNLHWLYDCDFMFDQFNKPKIIEINPRMSGSVSVSISAGIPILQNLIEIYLNKKIKKNKMKAKIKIMPSVSLYKKK